MPEKNTKAGREADMMATAFPDGHYPEHTAVLVEIGKLLHEKQAFRMSNVRDRLWDYYYDCGKIMLMEEVDDLITDLEKAGILLIPIVK